MIQKLPSDCRRSVLLTFDDGPTPHITQQVLNKLEQCNTTAVFFMLGRHIERYPSLAAEVVNRGHIIGNHSFNHHINLTANQVSREIDQCQQSIINATGITCQYYRHPEGVFSPLSLMIPWLKGLQCINWSYDPRDWNCKTIQEGKQAGKKLLNQVQPHDIILLHDIGDPTLALLDVILPELVSRNLLQTAVTLH